MAQIKPQNSFLVLIENKLEKWQTWKTALFEGNILPSHFKTKYSRPSVSTGIGSRSPCGYQNPQIFKFPYIT